MSRKCPDFIVPGAGKSGTTTLYQHLSSHPSIFIPDVKECRFFSDMPRYARGGPSATFLNRGARTWEDYQALFRGCDDRLCGDISPDYFFYYERSIENIKKYLGTHVPIIIVLRNPVDRVFSQYLHAVRTGSEDKTFEEAFALEDERREEKYVWSMLYRQTGLSADATDAYLSNFSRVKVYLYEEMFTEVSMRSLQEFIGVSPVTFDLARKSNVAQARVPKSWRLNKLIMSVRHRLIEAGIHAKLPTGLNRMLGESIRYINRRNVGAKAELAPETRAALSATYDSDIRRLEEIIGRDLGHWLV